MKIAVLDWYTVNISGDIPTSQLEELGDVRIIPLTPPEETAANIGDADIVLCNKVLITKEVMDACPNIKYIGLFATGFNNVDIDYAAEKGIAPPPIRGYRQENGHNTNKIMRVLNAFYQYKTGKEGKEPMPIEVFKERKKVINELSKV